MSTNFFILLHRKFLLTKLIWLYENLWLIAMCICNFHTRTKIFPPLNKVESYVCVLCFFGQSPIGFLRAVANFVANSHVANFGFVLFINILMAYFMLFLLFRIVKYYFLDFVLVFPLELFFKCKFILIIFKFLNGSFICLYILLFDT